MFRPVVFAGTVLLVGIVAGVAPAQDSLAKTLKEAGVEPTSEGVRAYLRELTEGKYAPLSDKEATALVGDLGHKLFKVREAAGKRLVELHVPPLDRLRDATRSSDPEVARRATAVLDQIAAGRDVPALVCRFIILEKLAVPPELLLKAVAVLERPAAEESAQDAFAVTIQARDKELITGAAADKNPRIRAAAVRTLALFHKDPVAEIQKHLKDKEPCVRLAASRALVEQVTNYDFSAYAKVLDADDMVVLLRAAERRFRHQNEKKNTDPTVVGEYGRLVEQYVAALKNAKVSEQAVKQPSGDHHWLKQGHDTSKHPEVLAYRIRWFAGQWSNWYVPGFNDCEVGNNREARLWGCFADHEHEIVTTKKAAFYREIHDLKVNK